MFLLGREEDCWCFEIASLFVGVVDDGRFDETEDCSFWHRISIHFPSINSVRFDSLRFLDEHRASL